jgi:uncharacterized protein (DUF2249 family)
MHIYFLSGNLEEEVTWETVIDGRVILKLTLKKQSVKVEARLNWLSKIEK